MPETLTLWTYPVFARIGRGTYDRESRVAELHFRLSNPDLELTLVFSDARASVSREYQPKEITFDLVSYEPIQVSWQEFERLVNETEPKMVAERCSVRPDRNILHTRLERHPEHDSSMLILIRYGAVEVKGIDSFQSLARQTAAISDSYWT